MNRLRLAFNIFSKRQEDEVSSDSIDRMARELKGSIFLLVALFELIALTSYLPLDSVLIYQGKIDRVNNLGGIVGALVGEWLLGSLAVMRYTFVFLTGWLSIAAFRGVPLRNILLRLVGAVVTCCLGAITCHLLLNHEFPHSLLFQGGRLGIIAGVFLRHYFNNTGSLVLVAGGFLVTLILTTGFSLIGFTQATFGGSEEEPTVELPLPRPHRKLAAVAAPVAAAAPAPVAPASPPAEAEKPKRKRRSKKAEQMPDEHGLAPMNEGTHVGQLPTEGGEAAPKKDEFTFSEIIPFQGNYQVPTLRLLKSASGGGKKLSRSEARANAQKITEHLLSFQITGEVVAVAQGPVLTTYEYKPSAGVKLSKIAALQEDLGVVLGTSELRVVAPIPGKTVVGIEVPREKSDVISLKDILSEDDFMDKKMKIPYALGKSTDGESVFGDITAMPHLLVAGSTGSGKSVFINSLIMSFLFRLTPSELRLILVDPKMLELSVFDGIPHLLTNVITDNLKAYNALNWAVTEMDRRYAIMAETNSKNIESFNSKTKIASERFPYVVIVVDELADLMMSGGAAVETAITRLAQKARAAGIHLVLATQRPSTDVVTGLIKANIPSRISFKVPSMTDSRTILDSGGAENLMGRGDSLMVQPGIPLRRLHGCFVTEEELVRTVNFVKGGKDHSHLYIDMSGGKIPKR